MNQEFDAIAHLFQERVPTKHSTTCLANGDDASVHHIPDSFEIVISTDTAVQGVHWPDNMPLHIAGERAVNAALSDLAAMGAEPAWIWLAVMAQDSQSLADMSDGIVQSCLNHNVELAGGDTVRSPINTINVTVGGLIPQGLSMTRNQAKIDDEVWLLGDLGLSAAGLKQWFNDEQQACFVSHFTDITPLYKQGIKLRELGVLCCLDISDGLLQDASHIAKASQLGIRIEVSCIESLQAYQKLLPHFGEEQALKLMLSGGEDYALCFTAAKHYHQQLLDLGAQPIGCCVQGSGVSLCHQGKAIDYNIKGYDHFG